MANRTWAEAELDQLVVCDRAALTLREPADRRFPLAVRQPMVELRPQYVHFSTIGGHGGIVAARACRVARGVCLEACGSEAYL